MKTTLILALGLLALLPLSPARAAEPTRIPDVIYGKKLGVALTMDVFQPEKPSGIGVIWIVSGGWVSNHDSINPGLARLFTDRGMTVFQVVHGSQPKFTVGEAISDIQRAVRFIKTNAARWSVDPERLGISGASAGGHLSLCLAAQALAGSLDAKDPVDRMSSGVSAVAVFFPPTDFGNYGKDGQHAMSNPLLKGYWPAFGITEATTTDEKLKLETQLSPIMAMTAKMPPTLLIHGDADFLVPLQQSKRVEARLKELSVPVRLDVRPGKGHGWPGMDKEMPLLAAWFEKYLAKRPG
jgi:acetyl esterase/lipase